MPRQILDTLPFELRFESLFQFGRAFTFPCDEQGRVDLDALSERLRGNYFFVRAMVGREFASPTVMPHAAVVD